MSQWAALTVYEPYVQYESQGLDQFGASYNASKRKVL